MLIRIIILAAVAYLIYRLLWKRKPPAPPGERGPERGREDVLVQDPWCKTYVPRRQALSLEHDGEVSYFCSKECRDRFLAEKGQAEPNEETR